MPTSKDTARLACVGVNSKAIDWRHKYELGLHSCDVLFNTMTILLNFFSANFFTRLSETCVAKFCSLCDFSVTGINGSSADLF